MKMIRNAFELKNYNTFGFSVQATHGCEITSVPQLKEAVLYAQLHHLPLIVLGGGSNVVLKNDLNALVLINKIPGITVVSEDDKYVFVKAGSGINWDSFVHYALTNHWYGLENLSIIPGTVGACPIQNVGAYGVEIKDFFHELTAFNLQTKTESVITLEECQFQYRNSIFKNEYRDQYIITSVTFKLNKRPNLNLKDSNLQKELNNKGLTCDISNAATTAITPMDVREAVIAIRTRRLPKVEKIGNAGSFYMNPMIDKNLFSKISAQNNDLLYTCLEENKYKISAGWLIAKCGWQGYVEKNGAVGVFQNNPLVLIHYGCGTADQLLSLSNKIEKSVFDQFGVQLKMEPRLYC